MKFSGPQIVRIAMTLITLVGVMLLAKPCANAVSNFVMSYEQGKGSAMPKPGNVDQPTEPRAVRATPTWDVRGRDQGGHRALQGQAASRGACADGRAYESTADDNSAARRHAVVRWGGDRRAPHIPAPHGVPRR